MGRAGKFLSSAVVAFFLMGMMSPAVRAQAYQLSPKELIIMNAMLENEIALFLGGERTLLFPDGPSPVGAGAAAKKYQENREAADQSYYKKTLMVAGIVESTSRGSDPIPVVTLRSKNTSQSPKMYFGKQDAQKVAALVKGKRVISICMGDGAPDGIPVFRNCVLGYDFASQRTSEVKNKSIEFLAGKSVSDIPAQTVAMLSIALTRQLSPSSTCFTDKRNCAEDLAQMFGNREKSAGLSKEFDLVMQELKERGVNVPKRRKKE